MVNQSPDLDQWPLGIGVARHTSTERPSSDREKQTVGASPLYVLTKTERPDRADLIPQGISRTPARRTRENKSDVGPGRARKPSLPRRNSQSPTKSRENRRTRTRLAGMVLPPRRKAVVVGCCYTNSGYHQDISLYGPANDAHAFALNLVNLLEFHPNDVCLLTDVHPSSVYSTSSRTPDVGDSIPTRTPDECRRGSKTRPEAASACTCMMARRMGKGRIRVLGTQDTGCSMPDASYSLDYVFLHCSRQDGNLDEHDFVNAKGEPGSPQLLPRKEEERFSLPTRHNIMLALNWLVRDVRQHDSLVFYFSGHGVQIDNMSGWEGEGYDEAILPWDFLTYGGQLNPITCLHLREILTDISEQCQLSIFLDCTGGQTLLDPTGTGSKMRFVKGLKQKGIWPITNPTDKVYRATYNPSTWKHPSMFEKHVRPRFVPGAEVDNTKDLRESSLQKQEVGLSTTFKAFQLSAAVWNQVVVEAKLPSLGIKAVGVKGLVADGTATVPNKPVVHGFFTWCLVRAMQTLVLEKVNMETKRIVKSFTFKQLNDRVAEIAAKAQVSQKLSKLEQINSLTVHTPSGSDPMREYVFYPLRSAFGAGLPYGRFSSKHVKESPFPYVPDLVQWFSAQHAEEYLIHYQKQKLKRDYFAREPSIASRLAHPHPMPSYWLKKVPDRPAFLTSPIGSLSPSVINHEGNPVYSPTPRRMGGCMQANCRM